MLYELCFQLISTEQIMSKIGRANEQNRQNLEELQQREIGSFWSIIGSGLSPRYDCFCCLSCVVVTGGS